MKLLVLLILFFSNFPNSHAEQPAENPLDARAIFWKKLYPQNGWTLYCGEHFNNNQDISIELIYSPIWAIKHFGCDDLESCRAQSEKFVRIESDLHNMYPALKMIVNARADYDFGIIADEFREFFECDFEREANIQTVEPRPKARGNIARAMLYMHNEYNIPIDSGSLKMLKDWHFKDPPSKDELRRNDAIESLQGIRNDYIDSPDKVNELTVSENTDSTIEVP